MLTRSALKFCAEPWSASRNISDDNPETIGKHEAGGSNLTLQPPWVDLPGRRADEIKFDELGTKFDLGTRFQVNVMTWAPKLTWAR